LPFIASQVINVSLVRVLRRLLYETRRYNH
jgi:hypothetical protein